MTATAIKFLGFTGDGRVRLQKLASNPAGARQVGVDALVAEGVRKRLADVPLGAKINARLETDWEAPNLPTRLLDFSPV